MNKNIKVAKELVKIAKSLIAESNNDIKDELDQLQVGMGYVELDDNTIVCKCDIPDYALSYLVNDDISGLADEQIEEINDWEEDNKVILVDPTNKRNEFNSHPEFGQACSTTECFVHMRKR